MAVRKSSTKKRRPVRKRASGAEAQKLTAWSYSRLNTYEQCPRRAFYLYIEKREETKGPALLRGTKIHNEAEQFIQTVGGPVPDSLIIFEEEFEYLRDIEATTEAQWAFTSKWTAVDWFAKQCWLRVKTDAHYVEFDDDTDEETLVVIDFKTGKFRPGYEDQLDLYATAGLKLFPDINTVRIELWYLDTGDLIEDTVNRKHLKKSVTAWEKRAARMLGETQWQATPHFGCRWCSFNAKKGGPCEAGL
jgi:hypothetical protein